MKKKLRRGVLLAFMASMAGVAQASPIIGVLQPGPIISVAPWLAPNAYGSPSFSTAEANAVQAMYHGASSYGTPGTPGYFIADSNVTTAETIVTGFSSWFGTADPGSAYGSAFANELGNRMTFAVGINGNGSQFSISELGFSMASTDPSAALDWTWATGSYQYGSGWMGVLKGADGILGTSDDTFVTSGPNSQLVDALFGRGSGNSLAAYCSSCSTAEQQAAIDSAAAYPGQDFTFTGTYSLGQSQGSGTFNVKAVPEPGTLALASLAVFGLAWTRRRKMAC